MGESYQVLQTIEANGYQYCILRNPDHHPSIAYLMRVHQDGMKFIEDDREWHEIADYVDHLLD
ncbi:DUF1292 domain-containing protein [Polycladospora coralii]|uniref:DUF1292 domain-containing protein n=1 Tax=Polycladospora coralii TaxID=2771432 RepID=UPI0034E20B87